MRWPFSTAVSFDTKLSAEEVRQRLRDYLLINGADRSSSVSASVAELPYTCRFGARYCTISRRVYRRETQARVLVLDMDSLRIGQELQGVWRPAFDYVISVPLFAGLAFALIAATNRPLIGVAGMLIMVLNLWLPYRRSRWEEPKIESFVRDKVLAPVVQRGPMEHFEIEESSRPGRRMVRVGYQFRSGMVAVYQVFLNPMLARQFLFATTNGTMVRAEINARVGGEFTFVDRRDGVDVLHKGIYTDLLKPTLISFDFSVPQYSVETATVTIKLSASSPGCRAMLVCDGVLPEYAEQTREGWERILAKYSVIG